MSVLLSLALALFAGLMMTRLIKRFKLPEDAPNKALAIPSNIKILGIDSDNTYFRKKI